MTARDLDALTAALEQPAAALREAALHRRRGYRSRHQPGGKAARITLAGKLLAAILHDRHGLPHKTASLLSGIRHEQICRYAGDIRTLLRQAGHTIEPAGRQLTTLDDLRHYAAAHGITVPAKIKPAS